MPCNAPVSRSAGADLCRTADIGEPEMRPGASRAWSSSPSAPASPCHISSCAICSTDDRATRAAGEMEISRERDEICARCAKCAVAVTLVASAATQHFMLSVPPADAARRSGPKSSVRPDPATLLGRLSRHVQEPAVRVGRVGIASRRGARASTAARPLGGSFSTSRDRSATRGDGERPHPDGVGAHSCAA